MRGADGFGAAASVTNASATGFNVQGVFRAQDDFCVLVLYDADNIYEHYKLRYLPDFDLSGLTLNFNYASDGLQPIDSIKSSWIDWGKLDVITSAGEPLQIPLWPYASYVSGTFTIASGSVTISGNPSTGNYFTLFINNVPFQFDTSFAVDGAGACNQLAYAVNTYNWSTYASNSVAVYASYTTGSGTAGTLTLTNAQTGTVNVSGAAVSWVSGETFQALFAGDEFILNGLAYTIGTVNSATSITLTSSAGTYSGIFYLAPRRGADGNSITAYIVDDSSGYTFSSTVIPFSGGASDNVVWAISLDFDSAIGVTLAPSSTPGQAVNSLRQIALTLAPALPVGESYPPGGVKGIDWTLAITNWSVTDTLSHRPLKVAGPGSVRIGSSDSWTTYSGTWDLVSANNYYLGFAQVSNTTGNTVTVKYSCGSVHDLYIGTELYIDRCIVSVSLDGDTATDLDCFLNVSTPVLTRRQVRTSVAAGTHSVVITLTGTNHTAAGSWDINSTGFDFLFDFIEAAVPSDAPAPAVTYSNVTPALDYDTDATYKMPPARLVWQIQNMGMLGQANLYLGVYWWNQRIPTGGVLNSITINFSGYSGYDSAQLDLGGFFVYKAITGGDDGSTIAAHFAYYINCSSVALWASASGSVLTITQFAPSSSYVLATITAAWGSSGTYTNFFSGSMPLGAEPTWEVDDTASPILNSAVIAWLQDFCATLAAAPMTCSISISLELVNPPSGYAAQFADGTVVTTATDFDGLFSTQTAVGNSNVIALQKAVLAELASIQNAAGLPVYLQLGEFDWWYFPEQQSIGIAYLAGSSPITIAATVAGSEQSIGFLNPSYVSGHTYLGVASPLGATVGESVAVLIAAAADPALDGVWIGVLTNDTSHILIPVATSSSTVAGSITLLAAHGLPNGSTATIVGVQGCTAANSPAGSPWTITAPNSYWFTIPAISNGSWTYGTGNFSGGGMAYYDSQTITAASSALSRSLASFYSQDDDPTINSSADADFLAGRLFSHMSALISYVQGLYSGAKFELLYPNDVNMEPLYWSYAYPFAQGGRLNRAVNTPSQLQTRSGSGFDRLKMEALSWGASYRNLDLAKVAMTFPTTAPCSWPLANTAYLVPVFNGGCPWEAEYLASVNADIPLIVLWAIDQTNTQSWPVIPMPSNPSVVSTS